MDIKEILIKQYEDLLIKYDKLLDYEKDSNGDDWLHNYIREEKKVNFGQEDILENIATELGFKPIELRIVAGVRILNKEYKDHE